MFNFIIIIFMLSTVLFLLIGNFITQLKSMGVDPTLFDENVFSFMYGSGITSAITFVLIYQHHMGTLTASY